jgi:hypothetical protein
MAETSNTAAVPTEGAGAAESVQAAGDVYIEEMILTKNGQDVEIKNFALNLVLYEDLFANVMMGELELSDAAGLVSMLPIMGGEAITFRIKTPTLNSFIQRTMAVVGVKHRVLDTKQQVYTLMLMSPEGVMDNVMPISRAYEGATDTIIRKVFQTYLQYPRYLRAGPAVSELRFIANHRTQVKVVSPYWTPLKLINWVCTRAISDQGNAPNVLFWESNKSFYCGSIEDVISTQRNAQQIFAEYYFAEAAIRDNSGFSYAPPDVFRQYSIIQTLAFPEASDWLKAQDFGYYAGTLITHDLTLKRYREHQWDYFTQFSKFNHLESYRVAGNSVVQDLQAGTPTFAGSTLRSPNSYRGFRSKQHKMFGDKNPDNNVEQFALQRNSLLQDLSSVRFEMQVPGRTDIEVGRLVYIRLPKGGSSSPEFSQNFDPILSGLYLVTAIRHNFSLTGKHTMTLEVAKDSFHSQV